MALFQPTYKAGSVEAPRLDLANVGALGQAFANVGMQNEENRRNALLERRQAEADARAKELYERDLTQYQREEARRTGLQDYMQQYGRTGENVARAQALASEPEVLSRMNEQVQTVGRDLLKKYDTQGQGLGSLLNREDVTAEDKAVVRGMVAPYAEAQVWKEREAARIADDLMSRGLVDPTKPQEAAVIGQTIAKGASLEQAQAQAEAATKAENERRRQQAENAKFRLERLDKQRKEAIDKYKALNPRSTSKDVYDSFKAYSEISGLDLDSGDEGDAKDTFELLNAKGYSPKEIVQGMRDTFREGSGLMGMLADRTTGTTEQIEAAIADRRRRGGSRDYYPTIEQEMNEEGKAAMNRLVQAATPEFISAPSQAQIAAGERQQLVNRLLGLSVETPNRGAVSSGGSNTTPGKVEAPRLSRAEQVEMANLNDEIAAGNVDRLTRGDVGLDLESELRDTQQQELQRRASRYLPNPRTPSVYAQEVAKDRRALQEFTRRGLDQGAELRSRLAEWLNGLERPQLSMPYARNLVNQGRIESLPQE